MMSTDCLLSQRIGVYDSGLKRSPLKSRRMLVISFAILVMDRISASVVDNVMVLWRFACHEIGLLKSLMMYPYKDRLPSASA